jgi:hypothetical protein
VTDILPAVDLAKVAWATEEGFALECAELREHVASLQSDVIHYQALYRSMYDAIVQAMRDRDRYQRQYHDERAAHASFRERVMLGEQVYSDADHGGRPTTQAVHGSEGAACH